MPRSGSPESENPGFSPAEIDGMDRPLNRSDAPRLLLFLERHSDVKLEVLDLSGENNQPGVLVMDREKQIIYAEFTLRSGAKNRYDLGAIFQGSKRFQLCPSSVETYAECKRGERIACTPTTNNGPRIDLDLFRTAAARLPGVTRGSIEKNVHRIIAELDRIIGNHNPTVVRPEEPEESDVFDVDDE